MLGIKPYINTSLGKPRCTFDTICDFVFEYLPFTIPLILYPVSDPNIMEKKQSFWYRAHRAHPIWYSLMVIMGTPVLIRRCLLSEWRPRPLVNICIIIFLYFCLPFTTRMGHVASLVTHGKPIYYFIPYLFNSSLPGQNGRHFPDDRLRCIFSIEKVYILMTIYLSLFLRAQLTIIQHRFRQWLGAK